MSRATWSTHTRSIPLLRLPSISLQVGAERHELTFYNLTHPHGDHDACGCGCGCQCNRSAYEKLRDDAFELRLRRVGRLYPEWPGHSVDNFTELDLVVTSLTEYRPAAAWGERVRRPCHTVL